MTDDTREISIVVRSTQAERALVRTAVAMNELGSSSGKTDAQLRRTDREIQRAADVAAKAARTVSQLKNELRTMSKELTSSHNESKRLAARLETANKRLAEQKAIIQTQKGIINQLSQSNLKLQQSYEGVARAATAANKATQGVRSASGVKVPTAAELQSRFDAAQPLKKNAMGQFTANGVVSLKEYARAQDTAAKSADKMAAATKRAAKATREFEDPAIRYALYGVAASLGVVTAAAVVGLKDLLQTGIDFQRNFANVERTSQQTGRAADVLRDSFLDLQASIPVTSEELTRIGTLAAQMGIAADEIANFTEVTAKFAAASGISADESATALARVGMMLRDDVAGDYERLASAILKTGVNAIATEQQIVRGTTQIASIGKVAGLSATDIVALSSAMSSLGMSPELQRSVITSSFTRILGAVRGSREEAEKFGAVLGMTGQQFQQAFERDGYQTYRELLAAIAGSDNAIAQLQELRLASQRLTPNLLKMGQAYDLLGETRRDTEQGWDDDIELQRQYNVIAETTAARIQVLSQAWDKFLTIIGQGAV